MPTEEGRVLKTDDTTALVQTTRSAGCEGCQSRHTCHTMGGSGQESAVEAVNTIGAREGDQVVLEFSTGSLMKGTFLIYMFPILCLLAGAGIGVKLSPLFAGLDESVLPAVIGFGAFVLSIILVVFLGNRLALKDAYKPRIIRVKRPLPPE